MSRTLINSAAGVVLALLIAGSLPAMADYDQAVSYLKAGKWVESAAEWEHVLTNAPEYDYGHYAIGVCYYKLGKYRDAEHRFRTAIELNPADFNYHISLANAQLRLEKYNDVILTLDKSETLVDDAGNVRFHRTRGLALARVADYERAIADLRQANPAEDSSVAFELARTCSAIGDTACVESAIGQLLAQKPGDAKGLKILTNAQLEAAGRASSVAAKRNAYKKAAGAARKLVAATGNGIEVRKLLGAALLGSEDYAGAIAEYEAVLEMEPENCNAMLNISQAKATLKEWDGMLRYSTRASRCNPASHTAFTQIAFANNAEHRWDAAEAAAKKSITLKETAFAKMQLKNAVDGRNAEAANRAADEADAQYLAKLKLREEEEAERQRKIKEYETRTGKEVEVDGE